MSYNVNEHEYTAVTKLGAQGRYEYFVNKITDWEEIWSISDKSGWVLMQDDNGNELVPVWPAERFAKACCIGEWSEFKPKSIPLDAWVDRWIPGITKDKRKCAVFPLNTDQGIVVSTDKLKADIEEALSSYE